MIKKNFSNFIDSLQQDITSSLEIIDGKEKVIVTQENIADNIVYVEKKKDKNFTCQSIIRSVSEDVTKPRRKLYIKIMAPGSGYKNGQIVVEIPNVKKPEMPTAAKDVKKFLLHLSYDVFQLSRHDPEAFL